MSNKPSLSELKPISPSDIGAADANLATNKATATNGQVLASNGDGTGSFKDFVLDAYTKDEVATTATKALYGLPASAVPDDVLAVIKPALDGKAKIASGTYVGTGTYGSTNPTSLALTFTPKIIFIFGVGYGTLDAMLILMQGFNVDIPDGNFTISSLSWGSTVSWYSASSPSSPADRQANSSGKTYRYVALG